MKHVMIWLIVICVMLVFSGSVLAQQSLIDTVAKGCDKEIKTYCRDVKQGEGRVLACLYAYGDKLSSQCEYALYDAAAQLEQAITALTYLANECRDDLKTFCSSVKPGEGRLIQCLDKNKEKVSSRCKQALKDTKLK